MTWNDDDHEDDIPEGGRDWRRPRGIFVLAPIGGAAGARIAELQSRYDRKLARSGTPHVTIVGSSGAGPIVPGTTAEQLRAAIEPVALSTAPLELTFGAPERFLQTNIVSLPLDTHGPLRALFEDIRSSGLHFLPVRFSFSPHATISFYPTLTRDRERELLALRVNEPVIIDRLQLSLTDDPQPPRPIMEFRLSGVPGTANRNP